MARQGKPRHKMVSSGRLTGCGRGQVNKKTVVGRHVTSLEPAYSLYSTDSEDQVTTIHKGLDRCAALLSGILQAEKTESKSKSQALKTAPGKFKSKVTHGKMETERKRLGKKFNSVSHLSKKPAPVQKTVLSQACPVVRGQPTAVDVVIGAEEKPTSLNTVAQTEHIKPHSHPLVCPVPTGSLSLPSTGLQTSTVFNYRLTTSTPELSPPRPSSAHSQMMQSHRGSDGAVHCPTQQWDISASGQSSQHGALNTAVSQTQYPTSLSVAPVVQQYPAASSLSAPQQIPIPPELKAELVVPNPLLSAPDTRQSTSQQLQNGFPPCFSPTVSTCVSTNVPVTTQLQTYPQPVLTCSSLHEQQLSPEESSAESGGYTSEDDDTTPVRDTSCQTSMNKNTTTLNQMCKMPSPEKTAKKVMTVKYLLGELKTLVANKDSEAVHLISEVEQSISLLPAMVGSTNVQAELALALQPLRSENVQLRRRLRILNQQLQERERSERHARSMDCNLEFATLQSLNLALQTQLNDRQRELVNLQKENERLRQALEGRENDLKQSEEQYKLETSRIHMDVSEALHKMRNCQIQLEDSEREKIVLTQFLQQKEAEITRLSEIIRNLQISPRNTACHPAQTDKPVSQLTKTVLDLYENQQKENTATGQISNSIKTYLQTLEGPGHDFFPHPCPHHPSPPSAGKLRGREESCRLRNTKACSPKCLDVLRPAEDDSSEKENCKKGGDSDNVTAFVPLRETVNVQPEPNISQKGALVQANEGNRDEGINGHEGLKYLGLTFEKLGISDGLLNQDSKTLSDNHVQNFLRHTEGLMLKHTSEGTVKHTEQSLNARRCLHMGEASACTGRPSEFENTLSCDIKSLASDWTVSSWSTFNTRDEQDFQNGLAALDASIASLQKTLKADFKKCD